MKRICTSITVFFLAVLILLGSGKFAVGKMICVGNGQSTYSVGSAKDCCEKNGTQREIFKKPCCELVTISYLLDDFSPSSQTTSSPDQLAFVIPAFALKSQTSDFRLQTFYSDLPPPDIKDRLYSFCSLLL